MIMVFCAMLLIAGALLSYCLLPDKDGATTDQCSEELRVTELSDAIGSS